MTCKNPSPKPKTTAVRQKKYVSVGSGIGWEGLSIRNTIRMTSPGRGTHLKFSRHSFQIRAFIDDLSVFGRA
jgi:hypothetical protein